MTLTRRELARLLTRVENGQADDELAALYPQTGRAHIIGLTGAPGTGKSSLVSALTQHYRSQGLTVAIIAVDPTSPFSGGAILGDRIRMRDLSGDVGVFIRSMATRGALGGLAVTTTDMIRVLDAAGFDIVLVETVGAGQSEVDIAGAAQTTLVLEAPGAGDDIQAIKAGILEIADILVVNKADRAGVESTVKALRAMLDLGHRAEPIVHHTLRMESINSARPHDQAEAVEMTISGWQPPILQTVATEARGIPELADQIAAHRAYLRQGGVLEQRERARLSAEIAERLRERLLAQLLAHIDTRDFEALLDRVLAREIDPLFAVRVLMSDNSHKHPIENK